MRRAVVLVALGLWVGASVLSGACLAEPDPYFPELLGEGEEPASVIEALRPAAETDLNAALRLGWLLHVYENDNAAAKGFFERVVERDTGNVWARFGLASIAALEADAAGVCEQMTAVVAHQPDHPLVELALRERGRLWPYVPEARAATAPLLRGFLDDARVMSPEARCLALDALWSSLDWAGLGDERDALLPTTGAVCSWRFAGPFVPLEDLSFFAELEPDGDSVLAESYVVNGRVKATRRHDSPVASIEPEWVDRGVVYAETFIRSAEPVRALLRVRSGGSIRVEIDGGTVYLKDRFHSFAPLAEIIEVALPAGWSRLRVKYQAPDRVVVRLLDALGRPLEVEVEPSPREDMTKPAASSKRPPSTAEVAAQSVPTTCEAYLGKLAAADPANPLVLALAARLHRVRGNTEAAKIAILRSLEVHDGWAASQLEGGLIISGDRTQPERIARSQAKAHYNRAITLAGTCPLALYELALYEQREERYDEAIEKLEQCVEQAPDNVLWYGVLYDIFTTRGWAKEREWALAAMAARNADAPGVVRAALDYADELNRFDAVLEAQMRLHTGTRRSTYLARFLERTGRLDEAIDEYKRLARQFPDGRWHTRSLIRLLKTLGRFDEAARLIGELLGDEPHDTGLIEELAAIELTRGRTNEAIRLWRRLLEVEPADTSARKALALHGETDILDEHDIDIAPYLADASLRERYAEYASVMVVDYAVEQVFATGSGRQLTHQLVLVNTKAAIGDWGEVALPYDAELLELRVIKPDGTIIEPEIIGDKGTISLTGLAEGDFIEMKYIEPSGGARGGRPSLLGARFFFSSGDEPMHLTRYLVVAPVGLDLAIEQVNLEQAPSTWERGGWRFWQWERREVEPIRPEPGGVSPDEYMPWVRVGFGQRLGFEAAAYQDSSLGMTTPTLEVRRLVDELVTPEMDRDAIVRTLHTWVNTNIDGGGSGPGLNSSASYTLGAKRGCRMALLKAMLDVAGVESHIVMARPATAFDSKVFLTENRFSYGLLLVDGGGESDIWIDLNNKFYPLGFVHPQVQGGRAVVLPNVDRWAPGLRVDLDRARDEVHVPVRPETFMTQQIDADLQVDEAGTLDATVTMTLTSVTAAGARGQLEQVDEDQLQRIVQMIINGLFPGATLREHVFEDREAFDKPLVARASFTVPKYARSRRRSLRFNKPLFPLNLRKTHARVTDRKTPIGMFGLPSSHYKVTITLPEGVTLEHALPPLALESRFGSYTFSFEFDEAAHQAVMERTFTMPIQRIQPADYDDFIAFCRSVDEHEEEELKVTLPEKPEPPDEAVEPVEAAEDEPAETDQEQPAEEEVPAAVAD